jgi:hypothetical protein
MSKGAIVLGTGPSAAGFVAPPGVPVIAVNQALHIALAHYWFSLDWSAVNRQTLARWRDYPGVQFCVADIPGADHWQTDAPVKRFERVSYQGEEPADKESAGWWLWRWSAVLGIPSNPGVIHSGNSAWGAVQLAYYLGYRRVLLVGVDGSQEEKITGRRPNNLSHLDILFKSALDVMEIKRLKSNAPSTITLDQINLSDALKWMR